MNNDRSLVRYRVYKQVGPPSLSLHKDVTASISRLKDFVLLKIKKMEKLDAWDIYDYDGYKSHVYSCDKAE